ncbi:vitrin-like [Protopterus annectens]|uniref:vitrin-like n=1 Tax=Protopterus annectens TaxID=7888 RepID=UPI001CFC2CF1|nr:vitrin-like [Protopterus annectens]
MKTVAVLLLAVLPLCGAVDIVCSTTARSLTDAQIEVQCPSGCATEGGTVWGTGTYTDDSSVCRAAVHDGKIPISGGKVIVEKKPGQSSYMGSTKNGVTTNSYGSWAGSFVLTPVASVVLQCVDKATSLSASTTV